MTIQNRLLEYLAFKGITPYRFCKDLNFSLGYLDKKGAIGTDKYLKIIEYYVDISPEWLLTGKGDMIKEVMDAKQPVVKEKEDGEINPLNYKELWKSSEYTISLQKEKIASLERELEGLKYANKEPIAYVGLAEPGDLSQSKKRTNK